MRISKKLLRYEVFEFTQKLKQQWDGRNSRNLKDYLEHIDYIRNFLDDFCVFFTERHFGKDKEKDGL